MSLESVKTLLILGNNPETALIVETANAMGIRTLVTNQFSSSPAKKVASVKYGIDPTNQMFIDELILKEKVTGVLLGVSDPLLPYYFEICKRNNLPCYVNERTAEAFSSKKNFASICQEFGIKSIPQIAVTSLMDFEINEELFPVVVKPIDGGASVGVSICRNSEELKQGLHHAIKVSIRGEAVIEKTMNCDDLFAYYFFAKGRPYLAAIADRHKSEKHGDLKRVCLYAEYPSKHRVEFLNSVHPKLLLMFESLQISDAVLSIQFFYDGEDFYAYDPGFRIQGEAPHVYIRSVFGFDHTRFLIRQALGKASIETLKIPLNQGDLNGNYGRTVWVLGKPGVIGRITGLTELAEDPNIVSILPRFALGDEITKEMESTERQILMRIYLVSDSIENLNNSTRSICMLLHVEDAYGQNLIQDVYCPEI